MADRSVFDLHGLDAIGQRRIDGQAAVGGEINETLRKIAVVGREGCADFALGNVLVEASAKRLVGDSDWIVRAGSLVRAGAAANGEDCGHRENRDADKSEEWVLRDANDSHLPSPDLCRAASGARCPRTKPKFVAF